MLILDIIDPMAQEDYLEGAETGSIDVSFA
jgi:hypothetical protein